MSRDYTATISERQQGGAVYVFRLLDTLHRFVSLILSSGGLLPWPLPAHNDAWKGMLPSRRLFSGYRPPARLKHVLDGLHVTACQGTSKCITRRRLARRCLARSGSEKKSCWVAAAIACLIRNRAGLMAGLSALQRPDVLV